MAQGGKTSPVESSEQETGGDADTFLNIVVFDLATVGGEAIINSEYGYKIYMVRFQGRAFASPGRNGFLDFRAPLIRQRRESGA